MRRFLSISLLLLTLCNVSLAVAYACSCTDKWGYKCVAQYCRTNSDGTCSCQDVPFDKGGGGALAEEMMLAY